LVPSSKEEPERLFTELSQDGTVLMPMADDAVVIHLKDIPRYTTIQQISANLTRRRCTNRRAEWTNACSSVGAVEQSI
jgi:hypothetical protein